MLRKGARIRAKLIEAIDEDHWIVSFQGQLIQVKNITDIPFEEGMLLNLQVEKIDPIQLKVLGPYNNSRKSLDIFI